MTGTETGLRQLTVVKHGSSRIFLHNEDGDLSELTLAARPDGVSIRTFTLPGYTDMILFLSDGAWRNIGNLEQLKNIMRRGLNPDQSVRRIMAMIESERTKRTNDDASVLMAYINHKPLT